MPISGVIPQIRTTNLAHAIDFYVATLGFALVFRYSDFYAGIKVGEQFVHLKLVDSQDPSIPFVADGDHIHLYFPTSDVEAEARRLRGHGVTFRKEVSDTAWGTREFWVLDHDGHTLCFGQPLLREPAQSHSSAHRSTGRPGEP